MMEALMKEGSRTRGTRTVLVAALVLLGFAVSGAGAQPDTKRNRRAAGLRPGETAPDFTLPDHEGREHKLSRLKGKIVVLEWFNPQCPWVVRGHEGGVLKDLAARLTRKKDVVWLAINSGGPGKPGHGVELNMKYARKWKMNHPILFDESGEVGRKYGARTTPHIFVIGKDGKLAYQGAPDNLLDVRRGRAEKRECWVDLVVEALRHGEKLPVKRTRPYG